MKINLTILTILISLLAVALFAANGNDSLAVEDIVEKMDELYRSQSSYAVMEMQIVTPHWERTLSLEAWSEGMDKTFIVINSPKKEKGTATLRIGNEMWNYLPKTDKVMKIPPSMMMGSWMGSDFTNDDIVKESSMREDYTYEFFSPDEPKEDLIYIELIPKEDTPVVWGKIETAVRSKDYLPVWQKFYDEKGNLMRIMEFKEIKEMGGRTIPTVMELTPQDEEGHKTIVRYLEAKFNIELDDDTFTLRNLQKKR